MKELKRPIACASAIIFLAGCSHPAINTSNFSNIRRVDNHIFFQTLPKTIATFSTRENLDEDRRIAVKQAINFAKSNGCQFISLVSKYSDPKTINEGLRSNKLRWHGDHANGQANINHERSHMVKTPDDRYFIIYNAPEEAFGSTSAEEKGNVWLCLMERGDNITKKELLVDMNDFRF